MARQGIGVALLKAIVRNGTAPLRFAVRTASEGAVEPFAAAEPYSRQS